MRVPSLEPSRSPGLPWRAGLVAGAAIGALAAGLGYLEAGRGVEERFALRWLFSARGEIGPPAGVAIVAINRRSAREIFLPEDPARFHRCRGLSIGTPRYGYAPLPALPARWPRCLHAVLIERLSAAGARVIVFDVLFRSRRALPIHGETEDVLAEEDRRLACAARESARVLIAGKLEPGHGDTLAPAPLSPLIEEAVLGMAPAPLPVTGVDRYDRFHVFVNDGWPTVTLPALAALAYALPAYDRFRRLLVEAAPRLGADLPPSARDIKSGNLETTALLLRAGLARDTAAQANLHAVLDRTDPGADHAAELMRSMLAIYAGPPTRHTNFYGRPGRIPTRDFSDVLALSAPELSAWARDKVIVVGYHEDEAVEQVEHFPTAFTAPGQVGHSGVEILATAIGNLLERSDLRVASHGLRIGAPLALALLVCVAAYSAGTALALALALAAAAAYAGLAFLAFAHARLWFPLAVPLASTLVLGLGSGLAFRYREARRQQERIRSLFVKFVPRGFVEAFERNAENALAQRQSLECISVATDAAQFTTLAESMAPHELAQLLNRYFERLFRPVAETDGFVSDIVGDAMLALWPLRAPHTRSAACHALLEMLEATTEFSRTAAKGGLQTRFGAHLGPVSLGAIGGHERYEYRAVGDAVNVSNRLQELNKKLGTRILVSHPLIDGLDRFQVRDLGWFRLRGKVRALHVYELIGLSLKVTPETARLCAQFSQIARAIHASELQRARSLLREVRTEFPGDKAAEFLLDVLARPGAVRDGVIIPD